VARRGFVHGEGRQSADARHDLDGKPVMSPIEGVDLQFAVNTNWDVFQDAAGTWYVRNQSTWLKSSALDKPWTAAGPLPVSFAKLPNDDNWKEVRANLPGVHRR
jgi:hypothetical protein